MNKRMAPEADSPEVPAGVRDAHLLRINGYRDHVIAKLAAKGFKHQDIEDAFAQTVVKILERPEIVPDSWSFTWLFVVVRNEVLQALRQEKSHAPLREDDLLPGKDVSVPDQLDEVHLQTKYAQVQAMLPDLIVELPPQLNEAAQLIIGEGLSNRVVSQRLSIHEGTISRRMDGVADAIRSALRRKRILDFNDTKTGSGRKFSGTHRVKHIAS